MPEEKLRFPRKPKQEITTQNPTLDDGALMFTYDTDGVVELKSGDGETPYLDRPISLIRNVGVRSNLDGWEVGPDVDEVGEGIRFKYLADVQSKPNVQCACLMRAEDITFDNNTPQAFRSTVSVLKDESVVGASKTISNSSGVKFCFPITFEDTQHFNYADIRSISVMIPTLTGTSFSVKIYKVLKSNITNRRQFTVANSSVVYSGTVSSITSIPARFLYDDSYLYLCCIASTATSSTLSYYTTGVSKTHDCTQYAGTYTEGTSVVTSALDSNGAIVMWIASINLQDKYLPNVVSKPRPELSTFKLVDSSARNYYMSFWDGSKHRCSAPYTEYDRDGAPQLRNSDGELEDAAIYIYGHFYYLDLAQFCKYSDYPYVATKNGGTATYRTFEYSSDHSDSDLISYKLYPCTNVNGQVHHAYLHIYQFQTKSTPTVSASTTVNLAANIISGYAIHSRPVGEAIEVPLLSTQTDFGVFILSDAALPVSNITTSGGSMFITLSAVVSIQPEIYIVDAHGNVVAKITDKVIRSLSR